MKKKIILSVIFIILICFVVLTVVFHKDTVVVSDIKSTKTELSKTDFVVSQEQIEQINSCYNYTEYYYANNITTDIKTLNDIVSEIDSVLSNDIFFYGFSDSKYQKKLETDKSYYKNNGLESENSLKHCYYKELVVVKLKALLLLERIEEFEKCFIENYFLLSMVSDGFVSLISLDDNISQNDRAIENIIKCYDKILTMNLSDRDKFYVTTDAGYVYQFGDFAEIKAKEYMAIREELNYDYEEDGPLYKLDSKELNKDNICFDSYEVKI